MSARRYRALAVLCSALALGACADGYPNQDSPLLLSYGMSQDKAMAAMHHLGHQRHLTHHWHYELLPGCVLQAQAKRFWGDRDEVRVALRMGAAVSDRDTTSGNFTVAVLPGSADAERVVVLEGVDAVSATQMKWLLDFLPRFCGAGAT